MAAVPPLFGKNLGTDIKLVPQNLTMNSTTPQCPLGSIATTGDGRYFRQVLVGASALVPGKLYQAAAETTSWQDLDIAAAAIGDTSITTTSTITVTANQLAGGYIVITNGTGSGYTYQISSHPAATGAVCTFQLVDAVQATTPNSVDVDLVMSEFSNVILKAATNSGECVGAAVFPVSAGNYGWLQVRGPVGVLVDAGNVTVGTLVVSSDDTDGAVGPYETDAITQTVGTAMTGGSSTEFAMIDLLIS